MVAYLIGATVVAVWIGLAVLIKLNTVEDKMDQLDGEQEERFSRLTFAVQYIMDNIASTKGPDNEPPVDRIPLEHKRVYISPDGEVKLTDKELIEDGNVTFLTYRPKDK